MYQTKFGQSSFPLWALDEIRVLLLFNYFSIYNLRSRIDCPQETRDSLSSCHWCCCSNLKGNRLVPLTAACRLYHLTLSTILPSTGRNQCFGNILLYETVVFRYSQNGRPLCKSQMSHIEECSHRIYFSKQMAGWCWESRDRDNVGGFGQRTQAYRVSHCKSDWGFVWFWIWPNK